jgi:hypothetical protein
MKCFVAGNETFTTCEKALSKNSIGGAVLMCIEASTRFPNATCPYKTETDEMRATFAAEAEASRIDAEKMHQEIAEIEKDNERRFLEDQ